MLKGRGKKKVLTSVLLCVLIAGASITVNAVNYQIDVGGATVNYGSMISSSSGSGYTYLGYGGGTVSVNTDFITADNTKYNKSQEATAVATVTQKVGGVGSTEMRHVNSVHTATYSGASMTEKSGMAIIYG